MLKAFAATAALALAAGLPAVALAQDEVQQETPPPNDAGARYQPDETSAPPVRNWNDGPRIEPPQDRGGRGDGGGRRDRGGDGDGGRRDRGGDDDRGGGGWNRGGGDNGGGWTPPPPPVIEQPGQTPGGGWSRDGRGRDRDGDGQRDRGGRPGRDGGGQDGGYDRDRDGDGNRWNGDGQDWNRDRNRGGDRDWDRDGRDRDRDRNGGGWNGGNWNGGNGGWDRDRGGQWDRDRSRRRDYGDFRNRWNQNQWRRDWNRNRGYDWWRNDRGFRGYNGFRFGFYFAPGYGYYSVPRNYWGQRWYPGDYLPSVFWRYRLNDWRTFGLGFPPPGTQWVAVDNHIYLIDSYDGYIIEVIFDAWRW
jgi:Ni/Co efflux regulator RcnB